MKKIAMKIGYILNILLPLCKITKPSCRFKVLKFIQQIFKKNSITYDIAIQKKITYIKIFFIILKLILYPYKTVYIILNNRRYGVFQQYHIYIYKDIMVSVVITIRITTEIIINKFILSLRALVIFFLLQILSAFFSIVMYEIISSTFVIIKYAYIYSSC